MNTLLAAHDLTIGFTQPRQPAVVVTEAMEVSLRAGELVCLLGPNGAGKSTLMRTLAGMQPPLAGRVLLDGIDITAYAPQDLARQVSIVLTERIDSGNLTVYDLVALGRHPYTDWTGRLTAADHEAVRRAIQSVDAVALADRHVARLSDGERQKVLIARALAQEPRLMLLDEPTAFLDLPHRVEIMGMLRGLAHRANRAILLSTHDLDLALRSADLIWLLPKGGALQTGAPEDLVLNGALAAAFSTSGIEFDALSGSFRIHRQPAGVVGLVGDGLPAVWTGRALERAGYGIDAQAGHAIAVTVAADGDFPVWTVHHAGQAHTVHRIMDLIHHVKALAELRP